MNTFTVDNIRSWDPRYDPSRYLPAGWQGTALDILAIEEWPAEDRLWIVLREECITPRTLRLFGVWNARQRLSLTDNPDPRSIEACDVAECFAIGEASKEELDAARDAAWNKVGAAPWLTPSGVDWNASGAATAAWAAAGKVDWNPAWYVSLTDASVEVWDTRIKVLRGLLDE